MHEPRAILAAVALAVAAGAAAGRPVPIPSGMTGDRAFVAFADPAEISPAMEAR